MSNNQHNTKNNLNYQIGFSSGRKKIDFIVSNSRNNPNSIDDIIASSFKLIENELTKDKSFRINKVEKLLPIKTAVIDTKLQQVVTLSKNLLNTIDNEKLSNDVLTVSQYYLHVSAIKDIIKNVKALLEIQMNYLDYKE